MEDLKEALNEVQEASRKIGMIIDMLKRLEATK